MVQTMMSAEHFTVLIRIFCMVKQCDMFSFNKDAKQGPKGKDTSDKAKLNSNCRVYIPFAIDSFGNMSTFLKSVK